jgi:hypothetical protein
MTIKELSGQSQSVKIVIRTYIFKCTDIDAQSQALITGIPDITKRTK